MSDPDPAAGRRPAPLRTRRVRLRTIADSDSAFLYELMSAPTAGGRVRFAGATPSPEQIASTLWDSVLAQFVVESTSSGRPLGLVALTSPNFRDGWSYLSAVALPDAQGSGLVAEGALLAVDHAFRTWPFRKIYLEVTATSYPAFRSGLGRFFVEEGRLAEHAFWDGAYVDLHVLAVPRATWAELAPDVLDRLRGSNGHRNAPAAAGGGA